MPLHFLTYLEDRKRAGRDWFVRFAEKPRAEWWLAFFSFTEASFFPLPPDILLMALLMAKPARWIRLATITMMSSVAGGVAGYAIGAFFFATVGVPLITFYGLSEEVATAAQWFAKATFWTMFIASFTPIPYKVFTITAGFLAAPLFPFVVASLIGRSIRLYTIGYLTHRYGEHLGGFFYRYFNLLSLAAALALLAVWILL